MTSTYWNWKTVSYSNCSFILSFAHSENWAKKSQEIKNSSLTNSNLKIYLNLDGKIV